MKLLLVVGVLFIFLCPGWGIAGWLRRDDKGGWAERLALAFAWSFAAFTLVALPFLWFGGSFALFAKVLVSVWIPFSVLGALTTLWSRAAPAGTKREVVDVFPASGRGEDEPSSRSGKPGSGRIIIVVALYVVLVVGVTWTWSEKRAYQETITQFLPIVVLAAVALAWWLRKSASRLLDFTALDDSSPPRLWTVVALALIGFQAVSTLVYYRPDWDDCYNLAAVLDYEHAKTFNDQEPTHREGYPVQAINRLLCWELWGAVLCRSSGFSPLVLYHTVLPCLLVLLAYAAYASLFRELLPRRWVPLALIGLSGYVLWGISSLESAANHFLVRIWQGKAVLLHIAVPLIVLALLRFGRRPCWRSWASLCAAILFGLGASSSAIFLAGALVASLVVALVPALRERRLAFLCGSALALMPVLALGPVLRSAVQSDPVFALSERGSSWERWFETFQTCAGDGSVEIAWCVLLPLLAALLGAYQRQEYLIVLPVVVVLTFGNPFLYRQVATHLTSHFTYYRIFWLYPVGVGLAVLIALGARLVERLSVRDFGARSQALPLAVSGVGLVILALLPGRYVWGIENRKGPFMAPGRAENAERMPRELRRIAELFTADPDVDAGRILCGQEVASFLTPYSQRFRFVVTRPEYTVYCLGRLGKAREAVERYFLSFVLGVTDRAPYLLPDDWTFMSFYLGSRTATEQMEAPDQPTLKDVATLLGRYRVRFMITSPASEYVPLLRHDGFRRIYQGSEYGLWKARDNEN